MAAGLTLAEDQFDLFTRAFDEEVRRHLSLEHLQGVIQSDGDVAASELNLETAEQLRFAGPWGQSFPEPVFDGVFTIKSKRIVGEKHLKLVLQPRDSELNIDAIAFNITDENWPENTQQALMAYRLDVNTFRGQTSLQLMVDHIEPC